MVNFFPYIVSCSETSSLENVAGMLAKYYLCFMFHVLNRHAHVNVSMAHRSY